MTDLKRILSNYSRLLVSSWNIVENASQKDETGSLKIDWLQANWEVLVEGLLGDHQITLEVYGEGADCNGANSRVIYPKRLPTHKIICAPLEGNQIRDILNNQDLDVSRNDVVFDSFVSIGEDGWYYERPDFDHVLAEHNNHSVVVEFGKVGFELKKI